jgi:hypothetical protein
MLAGGEFLQQLRLSSPKTGVLLDNIIDGVNAMAAHLGVDPTGKVDPPDPISSIQVQPGPDMAHVTLTDNSTVKKGTNYFVEHSVDGGATWHVTHLNASRGAVLSLPTKNAAGTVYNYQFRGYSQLLGSDAQPTKIVHGGTYTPTLVQLTGTAKMDLLPSTGSGTASVNGEQGGQGLGQDLIRPPIGPKRPNLNSPTPGGTTS